MTDFRPSRPEEIPGLRRLWKACFGDTDGFLDLFFTLAYAPERSLVLTDENQLLGAGYWFTCFLGSRKLAYLYAIGICPDRQNMGLGSRLMDALHETLSEQGYDAALLVPGDEGLRSFYSRFGYRTCSHRPAEVRLPALTPVSPAEYARLRRTLLPENGVVQEGENLAFLSALADFYRSENTIAALSREDGSCLELLGSPVQCTTPYAMGKALSGSPVPKELYFAFGFN